MHHLRYWVLSVVSIFVVASLFPPSVAAQATYTAELRGAVKDASGALVPGARVTATNDETRVLQTRKTDEAGRYLFNALPPASYTIRVEASGFKALVRPNVVLRVSFQADLDFILEVGQMTQTVEVTGAAPLVNTVSAALGTEVTNRYITEMPLPDRDITSLAFLAPGVTEVAGSGVGGLGGTNFASNGQRNGTAEFRLDGALATSPEGGEGGNTFLSYKPSLEDIQEFKLQNNSFSAEYGSNGGTVVNIVTKSGTNQFHGSGFYFLRRPSLDANDFFANRAGEPKGAYAHDQYGGSIGGPIRKQKTFFFFDFEKVRNTSPGTFTTTVPTALQREGDFSQTYTYDDDGNPVLQQLYNPCPITVNPSPSCSLSPVLDSSSNVVDYNRQPIEGNVIPSSMIDPIAQNTIKLFPPPTSLGDPVTGYNNFSKKLVYPAPVYRLDGRIDQNFSEKSRLTGRFSMSQETDNIPDPFLAAYQSVYKTRQIALEHTWTPSPSLLWTNRISFIRYYNPYLYNTPVDPLTLGWPSVLILNSWYDKKAFPDIGFSSGNYQGLVTDLCCTTSSEADNQWMFASLLNKVIHSHNLKFGGERRIYLNNFFQPGDTSGGFDFGPDLTAQSVFNPADFQGNDLASFLLGWGDDGTVGAVPAVANKSMETSFFAQDEWKVSQRLTLNLGLRYEWSTPYSERYNHNQFSCWSCDSGIMVPALGPDWPGKEIYGTSILAGSNQRHANPDYSNLAPRLGFAYRLNDKTAVRGGAGIYYGMSYATNWQYGGTAWNKDISIIFSKDGNITPYSTLENPFPVGFVGPQQGKYGPLTEWGYGNGNHNSLEFHNGTIYQWNIGIERQVSPSTLIEVNYSANRSVHLPWNFKPITRGNRNYVSIADREKWGTSGLAALVPNPFQYLFTQVSGMPAPIFNEPDSIYNDPSIPRLNLLRPYPQFDGTFAGLPFFAASGSYQSLQVRFERRTSRGLSFTGSYTFSKFISTSDEGANAWIGKLTGGAPQDLNNLAAENSISGNDTPHRLAFALIYELPLGRGRLVGRNMNRGLDAVVGGWRVTTFTTLQTGQPIDVRTSHNRISGGSQRPNLSGQPCSGASVDAVVDGTANYFNISSFSSPGDQIAGSAPRYFSNCRVPGIHNMDFGIAKQFQIREGMHVEARGEFFNFLNTPRFNYPAASFGSGSFGTINSQANGPRGGQLGFRFVF